MRGAFHDRSALRRGGRTLAWYWQIPEISADPESDIPVPRCLIESVLKCGDHPVNVKCLIFAQMAQVRRENQAVFRGFAGYIDSDLRQIRSKPCYHLFAIEVKAAMFLLKPCLNHRGNHRDVTRRRTVVHETLVAEACFHGTVFYITPCGEYILTPIISSPIWPSIFSRYNSRICFPAVR